MNTEERSETNPWVLGIAASLAMWLVLFWAVTGARANMVKACMSLVGPDMLFCTDDRDVSLLCDATGEKPVCQTMTALYRSWRQHPERREEFYRKLYGAAK